MLFLFKTAVELVVVFVHKATIFRIFFVRIRHHVATTDVLCTGDCQFYLLCEILDIYLSPAYVYWGLELVMLRVRRCGTFCIQGPTFSSPAISSPAFSVPHFPVRHFPPLHFAPAFLVLHFLVLHFPVLHFPVPHFPVLHFSLSNLTSFVPHFPVMHFSVPRFPRPLAMALN